MFHSRAGFPTRARVVEDPRGRLSKDIDRLESVSADLEHCVPFGGNTARRF
jgi:hypothetical protein